MTHARAQGGRPAVAGRLLVVATPLGNLSDMTPRGVEALRCADVVACEDTRRTRPLLAHFGVSVPTISCHKFNESARVAEIVAMLAEGKTVALVTDAGTPGVSDPGARMVAAAHEAGARVEAIPGVSAAAAAVSVCGFEAGGFVFAGFAPSRGGARRRFLKALAAAEEARAASGAAEAAGWPIVFYEAPHRAGAFLADLIAELGDRRVTAARELTKIHEEILRGNASEVLADLEANPRRGEFTIVVEGKAEPARTAGGGSGEELRAAYQRMLAEGIDRREALRRLARSAGLPRRDVYRMLIGSAGDREE